MAEHDKRNQDNHRDSQSSADNVSQQKAEVSSTLAPPPFQLKAEGEGIFSEVESADAGPIVASGGIQMKKVGEEEEEEVQMKKDGPIQKSEGAEGGGNVMSKMESSFGTSFSDVNIHENSAKATGVGALAYTQGSDIHFAPGQFKPETSSGQELLGHELTHVVQQREGRVQPTTEVNGMAVNDDKGLEKEADVMGAKAAQGKFIDGNNSGNSSSSSTSVQMKSDVIQRQDVNGRIWMTREDDDGDTERDFIMMRWTVPNWSIATWQSNMENLDDTQQVMGFLVFGAWPELAGCDHDTMWEHVAPYATSAGSRLGRDNDYSPTTESDARGLGEHLGAAIFGGDISTANIENYYNNATAPTERQKEDFFIALMTHTGSVGLQDTGFGDIDTWLANMTDSFSTRLAKRAFKILSSTYMTRALGRIANSEEFRSVSPSGTQAMAEYTDNAGRGSMFAQAATSASKGLDLVAAGSSNRSTSGSSESRNNGYNLITQAGISMQAVLRAQNSVDAEAKKVFDTIFDQAWGLIPGGGIIVGGIKSVLKSTIKSGIQSMIAGENYRSKIETFRSSFNRAATNLASDGGPITPEEARISVNALFSSSASVD